MAVSPLPLLVIVIDRAGACTRACTDECTFSTANQRARTRTDGRANANALRSLLFTRLRVSITPLAARDRNRHCEREHQQQD
jgi:hypothetical protein